MRVNKGVTVHTDRSVKLRGKKMVSDSSYDLLETRHFTTPPAVVKFGVDVKKSANYNSLGVKVEVELPVYVGEIEQGMVAAKKIATEHLEKELKDLRTTLDKIREL